MSLDAAVVGSADVSDCDAKQLTTLADWEAKLSAKYPAVGRVVPPVRLTLAQLAAYDGTDKKKPMYIAISGDVYDVTAGKDFYGPDGIYPFAGRECARAFALVSTDVADCVADVSGLAPLELDNLREWKAKFDFKYSKVRGRVGRGERGGGGGWLWGGRRRQSKVQPSLSPLSSPPAPPPPHPPGGHRGARVKSETGWAAVLGAFSFFSFWFLSHPIFCNDDTESAKERERERERERRALFDRSARGRAMFSFTQEESKSVERKQPPRKGAPHGKREKHALATRARGNA
jgi:membrane-associated progesterone receptor component